MRYLIDREDICEIVDEVFFSHCNDGKTLLDKYKEMIEWVNNTPNDIINDNKYSDNYNNINAEDFKKEMIIRIDCIWTDYIEKKLDEVMRGWNHNIDEGFPHD